MEDSLITFTGALEMFWHIGAWGLAVLVGLLWAWEVSLSHQHAKTERNIQEQSSQSSASAWNDGDPFKAKKRSKQGDSDILNRITRPAVERQGY